MFLLDGKTLSPDVAFTTADGTQYPANWLRLASPEEKAAIGITEAPDPEVYDQRFYWGVGNPKQLNDETVTPEEGEPYIQSGLKSQWISQAKATAGSMLAQSDWKITRASELPEKPVDPATLSYRASVRAYSDSLEAAIGACTTVEELIAVVSNQQWPQA